MNNTKFKRIILSYLRNIGARGWIIMANKTKLKLCSKDKNQCIT